MPWLTIIMALVSFFLSKKSGASNTKAALTAGLVGAGTYYVSHETDWGQANLGSLDGVTPSTGDTTMTTDPATGTAIKIPVNDSAGTAAGGLAGVLTQWGATGTATVIGATGAATGSGVFKSKWFWPAVIGLGALFLLKD